jgi:hypothetical protein
MSVPEKKFNSRPNLWLTTLKAGLPGMVLASTAAAVVGASELRTPESFSSIGNRAERSREMFIEAGRVLRHSRCLNCHPDGERPTQGDDRHPHSPLVVRGTDDNGATALRCATCHQAANFAPSGVPGHPLWHMAPLAMAWQGKSLRQICELIKDPARNGGRTLGQIHEHLAHDSLVGWAWLPGGEREPAPGTQEEFGALIAGWIETGAACPKRQ